MLPRLSSRSTSVIGLRSRLRRKSKTAHTQNFLHRLVRSFTSRNEERRSMKVSRQSAQIRSSRTSAMRSTSSKPAPVDLHWAIRL